MIIPINPAAVVGYRVSSVRSIIDPAAPRIRMEAYKVSVQTTNMRCLIVLDNPNCAAELNALSLTTRFTVFPSLNSVIQQFQSYSLSYADFLEVGKVLDNYGYAFDNPLFKEQVQLSLNPLQYPQYTQAFNQFVEQATDLLKDVQALQLPELAKSKGISRGNLNTSIIKLIAGSKGVHVGVDPYSDRFLHVTLKRFDIASYLKVRDLAYAFGVTHGLHIQFFD